MGMEIPGGASLPTQIGPFDITVRMPESGWVTVNCNFELVQSRTWGGEELPLMGAGLYADSVGSPGVIGISVCLNTKLKPADLARMMVPIAKAAAIGAMYGKRVARVFPPIKNPDPSVSAANNRCGGSHGLFGFFPDGELNNVSLVLPPLMGEATPPLPPS